MDISYIQRFFGGSDFLRPNRYEVIFYTYFSEMDKGIDKGTDFVSEKLGKFGKYIDTKKIAKSIFNKDLGKLCKSTSFPFQTFNTIDSFVNNKNNSVINKIDYDPVSFTFWVDADKVILNFLTIWKNAIIDQKFRYGYKDNYMADIEIIMHHLDNIEIMSCRLKNAFLVNIDSIELGTEMRNVISEVTFSVQYDSIEYETNIINPKNVMKYIKIPALELK